MSERVNTTCLSRIVHSGVNLQASMIERLTETQAGMEQNGASPPPQKKKKKGPQLIVHVSIFVRETQREMIMNSVAVFTSQFNRSSNSGHKTMGCRQASFTEAPTSYLQASKLGQ